MKNHYMKVFVFIAIVLVIMTPLQAFAKEKKKNDQTGEISLPDHVTSISKENTYPNSTEDQEIVEPSELTKQLIKESKLEVDNPDLIKQLNESSIKPSPIGIGYRGMIYLGRWPLHYKSEDTTMNWEYQKVNVNEINNIGGEQGQTMMYHQAEEKEVKGALTSKITNSDEVKKMILINAKEKTKLPLSYESVVGKGTKRDNTYNVPTKKYGYLDAYTPAVNEKGHITFGEVYIELKGTKKTLTVRNVTKQGIGAWIPVQDHLSFHFKLKD